MTFDVKTQNARADEILRNWFASDPGSVNYFTNRLTPGQNAYVNMLVRHVYALAYQEGWEASRTQP